MKTVYSCLVKVAMVEQEMRNQTRTRSCREGIWDISLSGMEGLADSIKNTNFKVWGPNCNKGAWDIKYCEFGDKAVYK